MHDEPTEEEIASVLGWMESHERAQAELARRLYGVLPDWLPEPILERVERVSSILLQQGFTQSGICDLVERFQQRGEPDDNFFIPGIVQDTSAFTENIGFLAELRYALSLGEAEGLELLAGMDAKIGRRRRDQQREFREAGIQLQKEVFAPIHIKFRKMAANFWQEDPSLSSAAVAKKIREDLIARDAHDRGTSVRNIRRIIQDLKPKL